MNPWKAFKRAINKRRIGNDGKGQEDGDGTQNRNTNHQQGERGTNINTTQQQGGDCGSKTHITQQDEATTSRSSYEDNRKGDEQPGCSKEPIKEINTYFDNVTIQVGDDTFIDFDDKFRGEVEGVIEDVIALNCHPNSGAYVIVGGSTVEGAAIARFFQPTEDGGRISKNAEVEVDLNLVLAEIPAKLKHLVEEVPGKHINVRIKPIKEFLSLLPEQYVGYFKGDGEQKHLNSYRVKEVASRCMSLADHEGWLKGVVALVKGTDTNNINFVSHGEITKPTAANDVMVQIGGKDYVNVSIDLSIMLKTGWFPDWANDWVERERAWPPKDVIQEMSSCCYIISKPSNEEKENRSTTEWSVSFHHIETAIAQLRSRQQKKVYTRLKCIVYCYIKPLDPDFASFFGKTIMFWVQEEFPPDHEFWKDDIAALKYLLQRLLVAVEEENLPYYFVPAYNIMKSLKGSIKEKVVKRLCKVKDNVAYYLDQFPVERCLEFYQGLSDDCVEIRKILQLANTRKFSQHPRLEEDQFSVLLSKLDGSAQYITSATNQSSLSFVGRHEELREIHEIMRQNNGKRAVVLYGIGGVGKSELSRQYASKYAGKFKYKVWVNGENDFAMKNKLMEVADELIQSKESWTQMKTEEIMYRVFQVLEDKEAIFMFDNIINVQDFCSWLEKIKLKLSRHPNIIVTSQRSNFNDSIFHLVEVRCLPKEEAVSLLRNEIPLGKYSEESAEENTRILGCHPLGLQVTIAYILKNDITLSEYNTLINSNEDILLYKLFPPQYGKPLCSTLRFAVQSVLQSADSAKIDLLCIMALLDGQQLEKKLLMEYRPNTCEILQDIQSRSLIRMTNNRDQYEMHDLLQTVLRIYLDDNGLKATYVKEIVGLISKYIEKHSNRNQDTFGDTWLHHALLLIEKCNSDANIMTVLEDLKNDVEWAFDNTGDDKTLLSYLRLYLKYETESDQPFDVTMDTRMRICRCLTYIGHYEEATNEYNELLTRCKHEKGEEDPQTLDIMRWLAYCQFKACNYKESMEIYRMLCPIQQRVLGKDHVDTMDTLKAMADCLMFQGDHQEAKPILQELCDTQLKAFGEEDTRTLSTMDGLASCMRRGGEYAHAHSLYEKVVCICKRVLGPSHYHTLVYMNNAALCMDEMGELEGARVLYTEVVEVKKRTMGSDNPSTLDTMYNLATVLYEQHKYDEARDMMKYVYEQYKTLLGEFHSETLDAKKWLDDIIKNTPKQLIWDFSY